MFCKNCGNKMKSGSSFCTECGDKTVSPCKKDWRSFFSKKVILIGSIIFLIIFIGLLFSVIDGKNSTEQTQQEIASSVVNIYCAGGSESDDEDISGGSGTIITTDGIVLTNAHIIPLGEDMDVEDISCLVILPDPTTGASQEIYYGTPIIIPDISEKYDLAFIEITDVYYDEEDGEAYGEYPKEFPAYDSELYCKAEDVKLGEAVRIYGYPAISGGYALTITEGIVSSLLPDEGYIITSAKISHGNSGGLAVDQYGCRIGIPSMVNSDDAESLGVIISNNLIYEFTDEVYAIINEENYE